MKIQILFLALAVASAASLYGQDTEKDLSDQVAVYLTVNGTKGQYEAAYESLLTMLSNQYPESSENKEGWIYMRQHKETAVNEILDLLGPIYLEHFNEEDILRMTEFYNSETGKQLKEDNSNLSADQNAQVSSFYNSELGLKIKDKQPALRDAISSASEAWSRDLYETAVALLKNG